MELKLQFSYQGKRNSDKCNLEASLETAQEN